MMIWSLQFCVGLLVANAGEWCMHRYLLHYYGKRAGSFWAYHWEEHHYAHLKPYWAKKYLPWHYEHHLFDGNSNWCVTYPLFDYLLSTRRKFLSK